MLSDRDKLCYKTGMQNAGGIIAPWPPILCYKTGDYSLVYKGKKAGDCVVQVDWRPPSWICQTYNVEHENDFDCTASFVSGGGVISRVDSTGSSVFTLSNIKGPAVFTVVFSNESDCITSEDPGVKVNLIAIQPEVAPQIKRDVRCPSNTGGTGSISVVFDASGRLTGVQ